MFAELPCERKDCRFAPGASTTTCMGWQPVYDRNGNRMDDGDPNITTTSFRCLTCKREFSCRTQYNKQTWAEWVDGKRIDIKPEALP